MIFILYYLTLSLICSSENFEEVALNPQEVEQVVNKKESTKGRRALGRFFPCFSKKQTYSLKDAENNIEKEFIFKQENLESYMPDYRHYSDNLNEVIAKTTFKDKEQAANVFASMKIIMESINNRKKENRSSDIQGYIIRFDEPEMEDIKKNLQENLKNSSFKSVKEYKIGKELDLLSKNDLINFDIFIRYALLILNKYDNIKEYVDKLKLKEYIESKADDKSDVYEKFEKEFKKLMR